MSIPTAAIRAGLTRGRIEFRHTLTTFGDVWGYVFPAFGMLVAMIFTRGVEIPGTSFSLGSSMLAGVLGLNIAFGGLMLLPQQLTVEREDGTLLRAKAVPQGMLGYLIGKIVQVSAMTIMSCLIVVIPGLFLIQGIALNSIGSVATLVWVVLVGLLAVLPIGAVLGSLFTSPRHIGLLMLPLMGLTAISGIFYPLAQFPVWLQWIGQVFPMYWLGLGMRSALLPAHMAAAEIGGSWHPLATFLVLAAWAVAGLLIAPRILRRMARRESGSAVAARREKAMARPVG